MAVTTPDPFPAPQDGLVRPDGWYSWWLEWGCSPRQPTVPAPLMTLEETVAFVNATLSNTDCDPPMLSRALFRRGIKETPDLSAAISAAGWFMDPFDYGYVRESEKKQRPLRCPRCDCHMVVNCDPHPGPPRYTCRCAHCPHTTEPAGDSWSAIRNWNAVARATPAPTLKPCPRCQGTAFVQGWVQKYQFWGQCEREGCEHEGGTGLTEREAITLWNEEKESLT